MNDHWNVLYQVTVFYADRKSKMAAITGHRLTLDPMGKCSNAFFSETTNMIKAKLYMNVHWMVLYNFTFFVLIWNSKWRLRQDLFNIGPYRKNVSKRFFSETKLPGNDHWKVLCFLCRSEIQDGCHHRTISGKYRNIFFSEAIELIEPKLCINHWKVLYKLCVFYVDRNSKMTTTAGHIFYIGPIGFFL